MMIIDWIKEELEKNGLFESHIKEVVPLIIQDPSQTLFNQRWFDDIEDYPEIMRNLLWTGICPIVLAYIEQNCASAWFRPLFDLNDPIHSMTKGELNVSTDSD